MLILLNIVIDTVWGAGEQSCFQRTTKELKCNTEESRGGTLKLQSVACVVVVVLTSCFR